MLVSFVNIEIFVSCGKGNQVFAGLDINNKAIRRIDLIFIYNISQRLVIMLVNDILSRHKQAICVRIIRNRQRSSLVIHNFWHRNNVLQTVSEKDQSRPQRISNNNRVITSDVEIRDFHLRVIEVRSIYDIAEHKLVIRAEIVDSDITDWHLLVNEVSICWKKVCPSR